MRASAYDAVVLAGGEGRRLGGVSKPDVLVAGRALLDHVLDAASGARAVVVVGPPELARRGVPVVREHPPSGGPVAGLEAGLAHLETGQAADVVVVLACDVPRVAGVLPGVLATLDADPDAEAVQLLDREGHAQLVAAFRRAPLRRALDRLVAEGGVHGVSVRRLVEGLRTVGVPDPAGLGADADTWDDVQRLDREIGRATVEDRTSGTSTDVRTWVRDTGEALGVDPDAVDVEALLDLARDVANGVARPAVPLTSFLAGYAVASAGGDRAALERVMLQVGELVAAWQARPGTTP